MTTRFKAVVAFAAVFAAGLISGYLWKREDRFAGVALTLATLLALGLAYGQVRLKAPQELSRSEQRNSIIALATFVIAMAGSAAIAFLLN
ncbi:MAG: hypothetical protein ACR2IE_13605 [Candidatus Sumerlaeaceae bacterium]